MSAMTAQSSPFILEREKHIEMLFRAFQRWRHPTAAQEQGLFHGHAAASSQAAGPGGSGTGAAGMEVETDERPEQWVTAGVPAGLAVLRSVSHLHITAIPELQGPQCISRRTYTIATETKAQLFVAVEESSCVCVQCCGPARSCSLQGFDSDRQLVFLFERPLRAETCCFGCCLMEMRVHTARGGLIGTVHQRWSMFTPYFEVCDSAGSSSLRIQGSCCPIRCLPDQEFQVVSMIGERVGTVWKHWQGYSENCNMDHEHFGLAVPPNMCVNTKVLLLAATFLLNHMFFEMS
ncbi:phospholipid scramblase 2 [Electrophorus electricus]|uniref:phospholipid scramblase 2 n=1 Tax=Electrophorus electricus TaxID=8005 RepID=UPI0015CFABFF|nr:phospholipid scramblase 2 [Electrophorus electricus]